MRSEVDGRVISAIPVFAGIPPQELSQLLAMADSIELGAGEALFSEDEAADAFYVLISGGIDLFSRGPQNDERFLAHLGQGAIIGETSLLIDGRHSATARASEQVRLLRFPDSRFRELLDTGSLPAYRLVANLARVLASRLRAADEQLVAIASKGSGPAMAEDDLDRLRKIFFAEWAL
ncbi:MAG TPA: cyclic nucleotide-binding domain-containing protein [Chloroflexota bacterium]|nr:cyclic nucleotide-binding domain-containing protein [Chloroflexota bacterium]